VREGVRGVYFCNNVMMKCKKRRPKNDDNIVQRVIVT